MFDADTVGPIGRGDRQRVGTDKRLVLAWKPHANGQVLTGQVWRQPCAVRRDQMKRPDRRAFLNHLRDFQGSPVVQESSCAQPLVRMLPVAVHQ